ncbi:MAG: TetR/AcrR family transcriptional regulator [Ignavibacteriae bacterium]|nr:TetR/AcrR family transcriptional regulator [Ignavibacteriota bacterium]MCB9242074.1 TetR/AcrR family transcriptional regulator [Ignavibacteriales bacterium]
MGTKERKEREKLEMQQKILDAARELFMKDGYENVSIRKIAEKIEYSPGTIYLYYKSKGQIFFVLCFLAFDAFYAEQIKADDITDPLEKLKESGKIYIRFAVENPEYFELMFLMKAPLEDYYDEITSDVSHKSFDYLKENIQECINAGYFKGYDLMTATISTWAFVHGLASLYIKDRLKKMSGRELDDFIENALDLYLESAKK